MAMATDLQLPGKSCPDAIQIKDAEKSFVNSANKKAFKVFSGLNITVPTGKIYSLLGPSGCGKTTLLRCILGREMLDKGHVLVFGLSPGSKKCGIPGRNVGYMPQETCIFDTMSIAECFTYYGAILGLSAEKICTRIKYYEELLKLPASDTLTINLSGGQGRRISFGIALFHHPKLIVLDEPTVGIDPIIKSYMWEHLLYLANTKNIRIILTTHYIEEARHSHLVGLIHGGKMATEDSGENLISKFNCHTLEEVCLRVCYEGSNVNDSDKPKDSEKVVDDTAKSAEEIWIPREAPIVELPICETQETSQQAVQRTPFLWSRDFAIRWRPLKSAIIKYILFLMRFKGAFLFLICFPSLLILLVYVTMSGSIKDVNVIVVDEDHGELVKRFLATLDSNTLILNNYTSLHDANVALRNGNAYGLLHFGQNFSEMVLKRVEYGPFANKEVLTKSKLNLTVDNLNYFIAMFVTYRVYTSIQKFQHTNTNVSIGDSPIVFNQEVYNSLEDPSWKYILFASFLCALYHGAMAVTSLLLLVELKKGYIDRSFVAGMSIAELLSGLMFVAFVVAGLQVCVVLVLLFFLYDGVSLTSWFLIALLAYGTGVSGAAFGMFLSLAFTNVHQLMMIAGTSSVIFGAYTGSMWPLEAMPVFFQYLCYCTPLLLPFKACKILISNTWHLFYGQILLGFAVNFVWCLLFILVSLKFLHALK